MTDPLEEQIAALARRSVGDPPADGEATAPSRETGPGKTGVGLAAYPVPATHRSRRRLVLVTVSVLAVVVVVGVAVLWTRHDRGPTVATVPGTVAASVACPRSIPRRSVEPGVDVSADALPPLASAMTDAAVVARTLADNEDELHRRYPGLVSAEVGPGFGRAWTGTNGGPVQIVDVDDYAIVVHLDSLRSCANVPLYAGVGNVPVFVVAPTYADQDPSTTGTVTGRLVADGGPAPDPSPLGGTVTFSDATGTVEVVDVPLSGEFQVVLPVGSYSADGRSPTIEDGLLSCRPAAGWLEVRAEQTTTVDVVCSIK